MMHDSEVLYPTHNVVFKNSSMTTKLWIVFNAAPTKSSNRSFFKQHAFCCSYNPTEHILHYSKIQNSPVWLTSDLLKMYKLVLVEPCQCNLQRILWCDSIEHELKYFVLKTITYTTASALFLASRCFWKMSNENHTQFPVASKITANDFYIQQPHYRSQWLRWVETA